MNYLCEGYKMFFSHTEVAMDRMARLILDGKPAAEIMND
jgi:uncharacterized protein